MQHPVTNHTFLQSLALGSFKERTAEVATHFMHSYRAFSARFLEFLTALISMVHCEDLKAILQENSEEEKGVYDEGAKACIAAAGITLVFVGDGPHRDLFAKCLQSITEKTGVQVLQGDRYDHVSEPLVSTYHAMCCDKSANPARALGALYFGSELIVPSIYSKILQGYRQVPNLTSDDLSFFTMHVSMDEGHATQMRTVVMEYAQTEKGRRDMLEGIREVMKARAQVFERLVEACFASSSHGGEVSSTLYDKQVTTTTTTTTTTTRCVINS